MADAKVKIWGTTSLPTGAALERYASALNRYLSRRIRRAQDAPDMVQEIFERFLRKKDRPEVVRSPFAYLLGIARNVLCEALGDEYHSPVVYSSALLDTLADGTEDTSLRPLAERVATQQDVLEALTKLPENHLIAIMLVDGQGMSYEEAAEASGFTKNTIATYVMHARAALRLSLPDYWSDASR